MENDLISRVKVLKLIEDIKMNSDIPKNYGTLMDIMREVRKMPAAYDVDKVVEQIECEYLMCRCKNNEVCTYPETIGCCYDNGIKKVVEIVKSGGIE